jgi:hypothetical protein
MRLLNIAALSRLAALLLKLNTSLATCLFFGIIIGTFPE